MKKLFLTINILLFSLIIQAQDIFWATKVDSVSSQYSDYEGAAFNILGQPNVDKRGRWSTYAWAVEPNSINTEGVETAYIDVSFGKAITSNQLAVFESFHPGAVSEIFIKGYRDWERVYVDTFVLAKTGFVTFDGKIDEALKDTLASVKKDWNLLIKDHAFQSEGYNILRVRFEKQEIVSVRIVLNVLAIDGWNQIDAVALANENFKKEIDFPQINLADQSLITEREAQNMGENINSFYAEINPIVSPDGKRLYFSRSHYDLRYFAETQNIYISNKEQVKEDECYRRKDAYVEEVIKWQPASPYQKEYNNILPNEIFAITQGGNKLYLNNLYTNPSKIHSDSVLMGNMSGISYCLHDTTYWKEASSTQKEEFAKRLLPVYKNVKINTDETVLLIVTQDSVTKEQMLYANVKLHGDWLDAPMILGNLNEQILFPLNYMAQMESISMMVIADTTNRDSLKIGSILWAKPQELKIKNFKNTNKHISLSVTPDDKVMFLAIENPKSMGERDLFVSEKQADQTWSEPLWLGKNLNTLNDEASPFLDDDGVSLYFASSGHSGYGEMDIYVSRKTGEGWQNWSKPKNLGSRINTGGSENMFIIDPNTRIAYYSSTTKSFGCNDMADLYEIQMAKPVIINFTGRTINVNTKNEIGKVDVSLKALDENGEETFNYATTVSDEYNGNYNIRLHELVDANKLARFALIARKEMCTQTNSKGDSIIYEIADIDTKQRIININRTLFLRTNDGTDYSPEQKKRDSIQINNSDVVDPDRIVNDTMEDVVTGTGKFIQPKDMTTCDVLFYNGNMYLMPPPNKDGSFTKIEYLEESYFKEFDYNQYDFSINEKEFEEMVKKIVERQKIFKTLTIHIVASASRVPTKVYDSNQDLAEKRAAEAISRIRLAMQQHNISENDIDFKEHTFVQGPKYTKDLTKEDYKKHQYIKIWVVGCFKKE